MECLLSTFDGKKLPFRFRRLRRRPRGKCRRLPIRPSVGRQLFENGKLFGFYP